MMTTHFFPSSFGEGTSHLPSPFGRGAGGEGKRAAEFQRPHPNPLPKGEGTIDPLPVGEGASHLPSPFGRGAGGEGKRAAEFRRPHPNPLPKGEGTIDPLPVGEGASHLPSPFGRGAGGEGRRAAEFRRPHPNPLPKGEGTKRTAAIAFFLALLLAAVAAARADEPAKKSDASGGNEAKKSGQQDSSAPKTEPKASPKGKAGAKGDSSALDGLDGLGFSFAPREGGKARTALFGLVGEGYKFVYVFDRSGSMGGEGRNALPLVKAAIVQSLKPLDTVHQFQIIYYNHRPVLFNPSGTRDRLAFATDENKERIARFLETVKAEGGTDHESAIRLGIRLQPDVIFLLTDGDDPKLTLGQLKKLERLSAGIFINTIQFGPGPRTEKSNWLSELARRTGGGYAYVDISKYDDDRRPKKAKGGT